MPARAQPGDPLRDRPHEELLAIADRAIAAGRAFDQHNVGLPVDIDGLDVDEAATTLIRVARWPAVSR